jgi:cytochrome c biogenesis protein CcmG/thiol:disulfide interchange protein DsbE
MNKRLVFLTPLAIALGLGLILFTAIGKDPTKLETARLNDPIPSFDLRDLTDESKRFSEKDFIGKVSLLNVWATWCPSCRVEHGYLNALAKQSVRIIGLNYKDERTAALTWLEKLGNPYEFTIYDPHGKLGFDLGVYGAPETYVVDQYGVVRYRHVGVVDERIWNGTLKPIIDKYSPTMSTQKPKQQPKAQ